MSFFSFASVKTKFNFSQKAFAPNSRMSAMKANILYSFGIKILGLAINLLIVPISIHLVNAERYGVWLTITSIITWLSLFDIGFGNGLRNKFGAAHDDKQVQARLVHTTLFMLTLISVSIVGSYFLFLNRIHWDRLIGVGIQYRMELQSLFRWLIVLFAIQFILQMVVPILYAIQQPSLVAANILLGNIFGLIGILGLKHAGNASLVSLGIVVMAGNLLSYTIFFCYYFFWKRPDLLKDFSIPTKKNINDIFSLGIKFFVLNVAYIVQYQTSNIMISRNFSSSKVTEFNIAYKLFSVAIIVFGIIVSPLWSSVTNAKVTGDFPWIRRIINKLILVWLGMIICFGVVLLISPYIYKLWLGNSVQVTMLVSVGVFMVVAANTFSAIFIQTLNGLSLVNLQFWLSLLTIALFVPVAYYLAVDSHLGVFGICLAIVLTNVNGIIVAPIQLFNYLRGERSAPLTSSPITT